MHLVKGTETICKAYVEGGGGSSWTKGLAHTHVIGRGGGVGISWERAVLSSVHMRGYSSVLVVLSFSSPHLTCGIPSNTRAVCASTGMLAGVASRATVHTAKHDGVGFDAAR